MEKEIKMVKYSLKKQKQAEREKKTQNNDDAMRKHELGCSRLPPAAPGDRTEL